MAELNRPDSPPEILNVGHGWRPYKIYKLILIGDMNVGKTHLLTRYLK